MAQIMIIAGSALVAGAGLGQLLKGTPLKKKDGTELSMKFTKIFGIVSLLVGVVGIIYGATMD